MVFGVRKMALQRLRPSLISPRWAQLPLSLRSGLATARYSTATTSSGDTSASPDSNSTILETPNTPLDSGLSSRISLGSDAPASTPKISSKSPQSSSIPVTPLSDSVRELLPLLHAQAPHYITAHIHGRPYVLTQGDTLRLPFRMPNVEPGDILRLNRASNLGSRDFTLRAAGNEKGEQVNYLDERLFVCRAVVTGLESEPMRIKEKTKRRQRHVKTVKSKHKYTTLTISELKVNNVEEAEGN